MKYWVFDDGMIIEVPDSAKILNIPESVLAIFEDKYGAYSAAEIIKEYNLKYKPDKKKNIISRIINRINKIICYTTPTSSRQ